MLVGEARTAHGDPAAAGGIEELSGGPPVRPRVVGVLERRPERLDPRRLRGLALRAHAGQRLADPLGFAGLERKRRARDHLARLQVGAPVGEAELAGQAALGAAPGDDLGPLEHAREVAAVGVGVHLHRAADGARDVHAELEPGKPGARRLRGCGREARAAAAEEALALLLDLRQVFVQLQHKSAES